MIGWILGGIVAACAVAGMLLSESGDSSRSYRSNSMGDGFATMFKSLFAVLLLVLIWGGGFAEFVGCVCIVLKLLSVEPVASWTWLEAFLPILGGIVAQFIGVLIAGALD